MLSKHAQNMPLVVSPLWQNINSSNKLVLAGFLAFYAVKTCSKHALNYY